MPLIAGAEHRVYGRSQPDRREQEFAFARFDVKAGPSDTYFCSHSSESPVADLRPLFNWNTKQVFVYFQAEYNSPEYVRIA